MAYMSVLKKTETQLRLIREPTFLSKAILMGFVAGILGIFLFGSESCLLKVLIGAIALFISYFLIDNVEICEIDKNLAVVKLIRLHWCQYLLETIGVNASHPYVTIKLDDVQDVCVQEQNETPIGKAFQVVFVLDSGIKIGATEVYTSNSFSEHEDTATVLQSFLNIPNSSKSHEDIDYEGDGSSSSGDDLEMDGFEQISSADIKELEEELAKPCHEPEPIGDTIQDTSNLTTEEVAAEAPCAIDDHGDNANLGHEEIPASS